MGCTSSKFADPAADDRAAALAKRLDEIGEATELEWAYRPTWGQYMAYIYEQAKSAGGSTKKLRQNFEQVVNSTALDFLKLEYPESAEAGTTQDLNYDEGPFGSGGGSVMVPTKLWVTLDEGFNGITYAYTMVIHGPTAWQSVVDADGSGLPARIATSPQVKLAQRYLSSIVNSMDKQDANVRHAVLNVIVGSVMVSARYKPHNLIPSVAHISDNQGTELQQPATTDGREVSSSHPQRLFRSHIFMSVLASLEINYPGCTVWDAGEMPFDVDDVPYAYPARLLICRDFEKRNKDVKTIDFKVEGPNEQGGNAVATLVRARDPAEDPGGIVCLAVIVAVDPEDPWPKRNLEQHRPVMAEALEQASKHGQLMSLLRGFDRCAMRVWAGQDTSHFTLITPHTKGSTAEHAQQFSDLVFGGPLQPLRLPTADPGDVSDLEDAFGVKVSRKEEHQLWASESQFQSMRHAMRERAKADLERYEQISILAGYESAATFMARNFAPSVVSEEGELPQPDGPGKLENTKVLVARDPKQEPSSIVAVLVAAPCPVPGRSAMVEGGYTWLGTPELRRAEDALMALLKEWYVQGKISTVDCFAQVMMGMDASVYQFIDGDKFVDYPDERMKQLQWQ